MVTNSPYWQYYKYNLKEEKFEDTKRVIRSRISKDRQHSGQTE